MVTPSIYDFTAIRFKMEPLEMTSMGRKPGTFKPVGGTRKREPSP
jgi:hypothetical protein